MKTRKNPYISSEKQFNTLKKPHKHLFINIKDLIPAHYPNLEFRINVR
ncbi:hypothetical protein [uncultured Aquimarina sp.]|nr:hypothetical protein [uncultured Aquimarina sp.]